MRGLAGARGHCPPFPLGDNTGLSLLATNTVRLKRGGRGRVICTCGWKGKESGGNREGDCRRKKRNVARIRRRKRRRRRRGRNSAATGSLHGAPADDCRTRDRAHAIAMPLPLLHRNMMSIMTLISNLVSTFPQEKKLPAVVEESLASGQAWTLHFTWQRRLAALAVESETPVSNS